MAFVSDPESPEFADRAAVDGELRRAFDVCHDCRRCYKLCPSFTTLLDGIDVAMEGKDAAGEVSSLLPKATIDTVVDQCFQCKLCDPHCPYTPPHRWEIDIPRLMLRAKTARVREQGMPLVDRVLGDPDRLGRVGTRCAGLVNKLNRNPLFRRMMERVVGVHHSRNLPDYAPQSFERWFARRPRPPDTGGDAVALFVTCSVNYNETDVGKAAVQVLERNRVAVSCPSQECCGMPALDGGDVEGARDRARRNLASLSAEIAAGRDVVVPGPTCSYMLKKEYPKLVPGAASEAVAARTFDICEYLMRRNREGKLDRGFSSGAGRVAYQVPCHLRVQNIGFKSRDLLKLLPETQVELIESCAAIDGTWGFKKDFFELSRQVAKPLMRKIADAEPTTIATDCSLAGMQIELETGKKPAHPVQLLRDAYGLPRQS